MAFLTYLTLVSHILIVSYLFRYNFVQLHPLNFITYLVSYKVKQPQLFYMLEDHQD